MPATIQKSYRLAPETLERIEQLGQLWGQVRGPLSAARVIDETVARIHRAETATPSQPQPRNRSKKGE